MVNSRGYLLLEKYVRKIIEEQIGGGKTLVNVDIQPDYEPYIKGGFDLHEWANFLNKSFKSGNSIVFLYNGADTLGMVEESDYRYWLSELGVKNKLLNSATFYDKGYNFFRNPMDAGVDSDEISALVRYMMANSLNDSRDFEEEDWDDFIEHNPSCDEIRENLEDNEDSINIPDLMSELRNYHNIVLVGGGVNECLKEVEIGLDALGMTYSTYSRFTY